MMVGAQQRSEALFGKGEFDSRVFGLSMQSRRQSRFFMIKVRARTMSWPQRYVSMSVYIFPCTADEDMTLLHESLRMLLNVHLKAMTINVREQSSSSVGSNWFPRCC